MLDEWVECSSLEWAIQGEHMFLLKPWRDADHLAPSSLDVLWSGIREASKWWTQVSELVLAGATGTQTSSLDPTVFYEILISFSAWNILIQRSCNSIDHKNYLKIKVYEMGVLEAPLRPNPGVPALASRWCVANTNTRIDHKLLWIRLQRKGLFHAILQIHL